MPEATQLSFTHKEVVTALVKAHGIHEGIWGLYLKFGIQGANLGASADVVQPTAIIPVLTIGLQQFPKENNIAVDAAKVNPRQTGAKQIGSGKTTAAKKR
jgi:hypothetical protein